MLRLLIVLLGFLMSAPAFAQERHATVKLSDGRIVTGKVVAMDLSMLQVQVDGEVVTIAAADIRSCQIDNGAPATAPATGGERAAPVPPTPAPASQAPAPTSEPAATVPPATAAVPAGGSKPAAKQPPRVRWPLPDPVVDTGDEQSVPHDLRHRTRLRVRLEALDEAYPWLVPTVPIQWLSIGLLLLAGLSLVVHLSIGVVGAEINSGSRCMGLATWYLLTVFLQVALVPVLPVATCCLLIANPVFALFWLRNLFGLTRGGAVIAFAVQLGFALLGYGLLELVTSLLGSIGNGQI